MPTITRRNGSKGFSTGMAATANPTPTNQELVITRWFDAPRQLVWQAWTQPDRVLRWLGPMSFVTLEFEMDCEPRGAWHSRMRTPEATEFAQRGFVLEFTEPERLVFTSASEDDAGSIGRQMLISIALEERDGGTEMTFSLAHLEAEEDSDGQIEGHIPGLVGVAA
jgi:uncharacterized protein YndB with AHSA1/START domain